MKNDEWTITIRLRPINPGRTVACNEDFKKIYDAVREVTGYGQPWAWEGMTFQAPVVEASE